MRTESYTVVCFFGFGTGRVVIVKAIGSGVGDARIEIVFWERETESEDSD